MKVTAAALKKLENTYKGYLEGEIIDRFFTDFQISFAAGLWAAGSFNDRFVGTGYNPGLDDDLVAKMGSVTKAGIKGCEFHDSQFISTSLVVDKNKIAQIKAALKKYKLTPTNMNTDLFSDAKWKLGGITNANKSIREEALQFALMGCDVAKEIGCSTVALWPVRTDGIITSKSITGSCWIDSSTVVLRSIKRPNRWVCASASKPSCTSRGKATW